MSLAFTRGVWAPSLLSRKHFSCGHSKGQEKRLLHATDTQPRERCAILMHKVLQGVQGQSVQHLLMLLLPRRLRARYSSVMRKPTPGGFT